MHWGQLIRNHLRVLRTDALLKPGSDAVLLDGGRLFDLGDTGYAAGDPAGLAFDVRGNLILALAGVDEVAVTLSPDQAPRRITVGRRPTAERPVPDERLSTSPTRSTIRSRLSTSAQVSGSRRLAWALSLNPVRSTEARGCLISPSSLMTADEPP